MRRVVCALVAAVMVVALAAPALVSAAGTRPVKKAKVDVDGFALKPGTLRIKKGTKVVWTWVDGHDVQHNVTLLKGPGKKFHSATKGSGTYSHVFTKAGTYHLYCSIHPFMTETVVVK
jgi:plastocyanin